jgi:hypothetical protein
MPGLAPERTVFSYRVWRPATPSSSRVRLGTIDVLTDKHTKGWGWYVSNKAMTRALVEGGYYDGPGVLEFASHDEIEEIPEGYDYVTDRDDNFLLILEYLDAYPCKEPIHSLQSPQRKRIRELCGLPEPFMLNPSSTGTTVAFVIGGLVIAAGIGYLVYQSKQAQAAASSIAQPLPANLPPMPVNVVSASENPYTTDSGS